MADHWSENESLLDEGTRNKTRAIKTLMEEIEAVMFYEQRAAVTEDKDLKEIMLHNRNEEIEHACMTLEWLRRNMDGWDEELRTYLFSQGNILAVEEEAAHGNSVENNGGSLGIGSLK
jgi:ferritin-like protein